MDAQEPGSYRIRVRTLNADVYEVSATAGTTVAELKRRCAAASGTPAARQRLIFRGRIISDAFTLGQLGELTRTPACFKDRAAPGCDAPSQRPARRRPADSSAPRRRPGSKRSAAFGPKRCPEASALA